MLRNPGDRALIESVAYELLRESSDHDVEVSQVLADPSSAYLSTPKRTMMLSWRTPVLFGGVAPGAKKLANRLTLSGMLITSFLTALSDFFVTERPCLPITKSTN